MAQDWREPQLGVVIGMKGVGKTYATDKGLVPPYLKGDPQKGVLPRRVLAFDVNNEYKFLRIDPRDVPTFCKHPIIEARRISIKKPNGQIMTLNEYRDMVLKTLSYFRTGLVIIEDITTYVADTFPADLIGKIVTQRHRDTDMILHFQFIGKAGNPKIEGAMNWIRFHKCSDTVQQHEKKFGSAYTPVMKVAECIVNERYDAGDEVFFCYVFPAKRKITGNFSKTEAENALEKYLLSNYKQTIVPLLEERTRDGEYRFTNKRKAFDSLHEKLFHTYFSFGK